MKLLTDAQRRELTANGERSAAGEEVDPRPIVKLFTPDVGAPVKAIEPRMTTTPAARTDMEGGTWEAGGASDPQARCSGAEPRPASGDAAWLVVDSTNSTRAGGTQDVWNRFGPPTAGPQRLKTLRR